MMDELNCFKPGELMLVGRNAELRANGIWLIGFEFLWIRGGPVGAVTFDTARGVVPFVQEATL